MGLDSSLVQDYDNHVAADALLTSRPTRKPFRSCPGRHGIRQRLSGLVR